MSAGGNVQSPAFYGTWFDLTEIHSYEVTKHAKIDDAHTKYVEVTVKRMVISYTEAKITSAEHLVRDANGGTSTNHLFNENVLPMHTLVEKCGIDYPYSKRINQVSIDFSDDGIASLILTSKEYDKNNATEASSGKETDIRQFY